MKLFSIVLAVLTFSLNCGPEVRDDPNIKTLYKTHFITRKYEFVVYPPKWMPRHRWRDVADLTDRMFDEFKDYWAGVLKITKDPTKTQMTITITENKGFVYEHPTDADENVLAYSHPKKNIIFLAWRPKAYNPMHTLFHEWHHVFLAEMEKGHKSPFWLMAGRLERSSLKLRGRPLCEQR